MLFTLLD